MQTRSFLMPIVAVLGIAAGSFLTFWFTRSQTEKPEPPAELSPAEIKLQADVSKILSTLGEAEVNLPNGSSMVSSEVEPLRAAARAFQSNDHADSEYFEYGPTLKSEIDLLLGEAVSLRDKLRYSQKPTAIEDVMPEIRQLVDIRTNERLVALRHEQAVLESAMQAKAKDRSEKSVAKLRKEVLEVRRANLRKLGY